jgi:hypothetical protein
MYARTWLVFFLVVTAPVLTTVPLLFVDASALSFRLGMGTFCAGCAAVGFWTPVVGSRSAILSAGVPVGLVVGLSSWGLLAYGVFRALWYGLLLVAALWVCGIACVALARLFCVSMVETSNDDQDKASLFARPAVPEAQCTNNNELFVARANCAATPASSPTPPLAAAFVPTRSPGPVRPTLGSAQPPSVTLVPGASPRTRTPAAAITAVKSPAATAARATRVTAARLKVLASRSLSPIQQDFQVAAPSILFAPTLIPSPGLVAHGRSNVSPTPPVSIFFAISQPSVTPMLAATNTDLPGLPLSSRLAMSPALVPASAVLRASRLQPKHIAVVAVDAAAVEVAPHGTMGVALTSLVHGRDDDSVVRMYVHRSGQVL